MLRYLSVRNLAVIDRLEVEFEPGLNVLTGETGAGKSILVEAIDLLVGGRASADLVRTGEDAAIIQAIFDDASGREIIVRREVSAQGRSRGFIDDTLATSAALRDLGATLLDLHGQHEHQALLDPAEHLALLDAYGAHANELTRVADAFAAWRTASNALARTQLDDREKQARVEIARFHLDEIDKVAPAAGEDTTLGAERTILVNADRLARLTTEAYAALYDDEHAALSSLSIVWKRVADLAALDARFAGYLDQRDDITSRLDDLARMLRSYASAIDGSPERLQAVEDRLAAIERLKRKHGPSLDDVLAKRGALREELDALDASDERIASLEAEERAARAAFRSAADTLSRARRAAAEKLSRALERALSDLAMPR
jgi:DNA repair protein RecN (Recombination protein N)